MYTDIADLLRRFEEAYDAFQELADAAVDTEDAAEETPKTMCRDILCTRPHLIRIDRIPWYTSGFQ